MAELSGKVLKVPVPPASAGYAGNFSNGEVQSGFTPGLLGVGAEVYAVGSARAIGSRTIGEYVDGLEAFLENVVGIPDPDIRRADPDQAALATDFNLGAQVGRFLADAGPTGAAPGTAAAILIGANDYNALFSRPTPPTQADVAQTIFGVQSSIGLATQRVLGAGVEQVLLYNLPDASFFPPPPNVDPAVIAAGDQVIRAHNDALAGLAADFRAAGADVRIIDINRITDEITDDPRTFGFLPQYLDEPVLNGVATQPIWVEAIQNWAMPPNPDVVGVDPAQLLFYDFLHPTTEAHGVLGVFAATSLTACTTFLGAGDDRQWLGGADDLVLAGRGNDAIFAGGGDDTVLAGRGHDAVHGGSGDDILAGGSDADLLLGDCGDDVIAAGADAATGLGGRGDDLLIDGAGSHLLAGNSGDDAFLLTEAALRGGVNGANHDRFFGGSSDDVCYLVLTEATAALVEAELRPGRSVQHLGSIGLLAVGIEEFVFLAPEDGLGDLETPARLAEADLWGLA
jgi:hypothetical protein